MFKKPVNIIIISAFTIAVGSAIFFGIRYLTKNTLKSDNSGTSNVNVTFTSEKEEVKLLDDTGYSQQKVEELAQSNNKFAFDLYKQVVDDESNIFFSPYSIFSVLSMTYEGARGETADEIKETLYLPELFDLRLSSARLYNVINKKDKEYLLSTANALWAQKDYSFIEEYFSTIENFYGGKIETLDFVSKTEESRKTINKWVEKQTKDKIVDLIKPGILGPSTRLVITNAIYFKGDWLYQFEKEDTQIMDFTTLNGTKEKVDMMHLDNSDISFLYKDTDKAEILSLPYKGNELSMLIVLPKGEFKDFEKGLINENFEKMISGMSEKNVEVFIPKFKMELEYYLNTPLQNLGIEKAFTEDADFSGMTGKRDLSVSDVIHKSFVEVNEEGSEAAAATAVVLKETAMIDEENIVFKADHPFLFVIRENSTGLILFMGRFGKSV